MADRLSRGVIFIVLAAVMVFSPIARGTVRPWSVTPVVLALYFIMLIWALRAVNGGWRGLKPAPLDRPLLIFAVLAATSFAFSIYKHDSFQAVLRLFSYIGLYYSIVNVSDHTFRRRIVWVAITAGGALSLYGLLQYFGVFSHSWWIPKQFLAATYVNHNHFAGYLELAIPAAAAMITARSVRKSIPARIMLILLLVPMFAAFILTQSRGAWVSLGISLLVMLFFLISHDRSWARIMVISALLLVAVVSLIYFTGDMMASRIATITSAVEGEDVSGGRFKIWQGALGMLRERPLTGVGIGDFDRGFYRYRPLGFNARAVYAHNEYLHMASEMGLAAPIVMIWIFAAAIREGFGKRKRSPYAFGCAIGVMSLAMHGIVDFNFHIAANMILFIVWLGVITGE